MLRIRIGINKFPVNKKRINFHCPFLHEIRWQVRRLLFIYVNGVVLLDHHLPNGVCAHSRQYVVKELPLLFVVHFSIILLFLTLPVSFPFSPKLFCSNTIVPIVGFWIKDSIFSLRLSICKLILCR